MIPAANSEYSQPNASLSRSSTFEKSTSAAAAQDRVTQLFNHLSRSNTMADSALQQQQTPAPTSTSIPVPPVCRLCRKPSNCPDCHKPLTPEKKKSGAVDIDAEIVDIHNQLPPYPSPLPKPHKDFRHCMPPEAPHYQKWSVFLAGSIEMGRAVQWQRQMATILSPLPISAYNPRRGHWNPEATPEAKNAEFRHQVEWEQDALEQAKVICFFFDHDTLSPVTMCELGQWTREGKVVVCCDKRFWKSGNVHIVCEREGIPLVEKFEDLAPLIRGMLRQKGMMLDKNGDLTTDPAKEDKTKLEGEEVLKAAIKEDLIRKHGSRKF